MACAPDLFNGASQGFRCFPVNNGNCLSAPFGSPTTATSLDGDGVSICSVFGETTCEAIDDIANSCTGNEGCGIGIGDGVCVNGEICSVPCQQPFHCGDGLDCDNGVCVPE